MAQTLREGLNLTRWQDDPQMTPEQLRRLTDEAVREARETAATEGYFSARVNASIRENAEQKARDDLRPEIATDTST